MDLIARAQCEIEARHAFFVDWFTGRAEAREMEMTAAAFAPQMRMIRPDGAILLRPQVVEMIRHAHGSMAESFSIDIRIHAAEMLSPDLALLIYDEHQRVDGVSNLRRATVLMQAESLAPHGVLWRHVQETWSNDKYYH
ncbi:MAG: hypothetical protein ACK5M4_07985 [Pseudorhodobacter sp.]